MPLKTLKIKAIYSDIGKLVLENGVTVHWDNLNVPFGSEVEIIVKYNEVDYLSGLNSTVWATYDLDQAETIQGALQALGIAVEIKQKNLKGVSLYTLRILDTMQIEAAIEFIWRDAEGLQLKPDWQYPSGASNESFCKWTEAC